MDSEDINGVQASDGYYVVSIIETKVNKENNNNEGIQKRRYPKKDIGIYHAQLAIEDYGSVLGHASLSHIESLINIGFFKPCK